MCGRWLRKKIERTLKLLQENLFSKGPKKPSPCTAPTADKPKTSTSPPSPAPSETSPTKPSTPVPEPCTPAPPAGTPSPQPSPSNEPRIPSPQPCAPSKGPGAPPPEPAIPSSEPLPPCPQRPKPSCRPHPSIPQPALPSKEPCAKFPQPPAGTLRGTPPRLLLSPAKANSKVNESRIVLPESSIIIPSFILHAFAVLAGLQGCERLENARSFVYSLYKQFRTTPTSLATISSQFLSFTLPSNSPLLTKSQVYSAGDPIRLAFAYLALSLSNCEDEANLVLRNEQAFLHLFRTAVHHSLVWEVFATSCSFAWSSEPHTVRVFEVSATRFVESTIVLPVSENTWFDSRTLATGVLPTTIKLSYTSRNPESFLLSRATPLRAMIVAVKYGADWDCVVKPTLLSEVRNTTSWMLSTSGGKLFRGVYIEPIDYLLSILQFGCINETKLYDLVEHDLPNSNAIRDLVATAEAIRVEARIDKSGTFRETVVSRLTAIRGEIREAVSRFGCVFRSRERYFWVGEVDGALHLKKAVRIDDIVVTQPDNDAVAQFMRQDAKFLIEDAHGVVLRSTRELLEVDGLGDLGLCVMFSCWRHGRIRIDASYEHLLEGMSRTKGVTACQEFVRVDTEVPYTSLFVLADSVVMDRYGQGWVEGCLFVAGRDGRSGWLVPAGRQTCCCKGRALVEAEFRVDRHLKIARW